MDPLDDFFREAVGDLVRQLSDAGAIWHDTNDDSELRRLCHSIKGSGGSFGFPLVSVLASAAERAPEDQLDEAVAMLMAELSTIATSTERHKILVVDDDALITHLLERRLDGPDRVVEKVSTIAEARQALEHRRFDLVILDLLLPDGDGRHLLAELGGDVASASVPVIVLSASDAPGLRDECIHLGAEAFVTKPFDPDALTMMVGGFLTAEPSHISERAEFVRSVGAQEDATTLTVASILTETHGPGGRPSDRPDPFVLEAVERTLRTTLGTGTVVSRWGDAELAIATPHGPAEAAELLDRARLRLRTQTHPSVDGALVSLSAGVVHDQRQDGIASLMSRARQLAADAHSLGGDRVVTAWASPPNRRVLLAEDDALTAALVIHRLEREGFVVAHYGNGTDAASAMEADAFDLVVLDVQMPGLDGFEVLRYIRSNTTSHVPVVMLTAVGSERDVVRGFELGADDYMLKPFSAAELIVRLKRLIRES